MDIIDNLIALANANKEICCLLGFAIIVFSIIFMFCKPKKKGGNMGKFEDNEKENEGEEEDNESDKECTFQYGHDGEDWCCDLGEGNTYCNKAKCPFWK